MGKWVNEWMLASLWSIVAAPYTRKSRGKAPQARNGNPAPRSPLIFSLVTFFLFKFFVVLRYYNIRMEDLAQCVYNALYMLIGIEWNRLWDYYCCCWNYASEESEKSKRSAAREVIQLSGRFEAVKRGCLVEEDGGMCSGLQRQEERLVVAWGFRKRLDTSEWEYCEISGAARGIRFFATIEIAWMNAARKKYNGL